MSKFNRFEVAITLAAMVLIMTQIASVAQADGSAKVISPDSWAWQNPLPQGNDLLAVWGTSPTNIYAVGGEYGRTILHYDGQTWSGTSGGTMLGLNGVWGSSATDVYAVGASGTILHFDGQAWSAETSNTTNNLLSVWGSSPTDVYIVGDSGTILHFDGNAWSGLSSGTYPLYSVWGTSPTNIYAVGAVGTILHYDGQAWSAETSNTTNNLLSVWGSSPTDVYAVGASGTILHFDGTAWSAKTSNTTNPLYAVWGSSATDVYAVGASGTALHFNGTAWSLNSTNLYFDLYAVWGSSSTNVLAVGENGIILSCTGNGLNWTSISSAIGNIPVGLQGGSFMGISGTSSTDVFAVGNYAYDGSAAFYNGIIWSFPGRWNVDLYYPYFGGVWVNSATDVFAVGGYSDNRGIAMNLIAHYDGSDLTYITYMTWLPTSGLRGVWGSSSNGVLDIFAVGASGAIIEGDGSNWWNANNSSGNINDLLGVWGSSSRDSVSGKPNDVYAVGLGGTILHYNGQTWSSETSNTTNDLYGVWGSSPTDVFAVGANNTVVHFDGTTWSLMITNTAGVFTDLHGVWGSSPTDVFAVGALGVIVHYDGNTWTSMSSGDDSGYDLYGVWGSSSTDVIAVGDNGTILHYEPPSASGNPTPTTTSISQTTTTFGAPGFTITVNGTNFVPSSWVFFNSSPTPTTTYISSTQLTASIPASDLTSPGTFSITVMNPTPGGGASNPQSFTVSQASTSLTVAPAEGTYGLNVNLSATLTSNGSGVSGQPISFSLNGKAVGVATTDGSGTATLTNISLTGIDAGTYPGYIVANFAGNVNYTSSSGSGILTVDKIQPVLYIIGSGGPYGGTASVSVLLFPHLPGMSGELISFTLNGSVIGSAPTDSSGVATLTGISLSGFRGGTSAGTIVANFAGDANYLGSSITGGLGVWPSATTTTIAADVSVAYSKSIQSVQITALVTSSSGTVVNEGYVLFNVDDFVCGNFGYAPVVNGQATNNCIVPANLVGNYVIDAHYEGYAQDFLPSEDATPHHHLNIIALYSDLEVVSFSIPPQSQSSNPNILTFVATVINHGPDPASVVQVDLDYYDTNGVLKNFANQITTNVPVNIPVTLSASIDWSSQEQLTPFPPQPTLVANAWSTTSIDVNGANNQKSLVLNGFYRMLTTNAATFEVDNNGYGFRNNLGQVDWSLYEDVFSKDAVEWNTPNGVVDKLAEWSFYAAVFVPGIEGGNCYGMSATSLRFYKGADDFHNYEPSATSVYAMQTNYALNDPVWHNIEKYQGYQFGSEIQGAFSAQSNDPVTTLNTVKDAMSLDGYSGVNKDPVILSMFGPKYAHAVVPYRIIETTTSDGAHVADIYIYDSNFKGDSQQVVSVDVTADTYSSAYSNTVFKFGGNTGLVATASALNDTPPSLPFSTPGVDILIVGGTANMLTTDNVGRSLGYQNGNLVEQIPGGRLIRPFLDSSTTSTFPEAYILPTGQYVTTLYGNNTGTATANFILSPSLSTSTSNSIVSLLTFTSYTMTPTTQDTIIFSQDGNTVTLGTNAASEHYSNTLSHEISNSARSYTVSNTTISSGETITMEVINGGASFGIVNQGEPKTYDLTLTQVGAGAGTTSFTGVTIGAGESQIFTPSDWNNLSTTEVDWQVKNSQGKIVTTEALQIAFKDVQRNTQLTINTLDKQFRFLATNFDSGLINAPEMKVINIDPSNPDPALRYNAKTKTWSLDPSKLGAAQQAQALLSQQTFTVLPKELIVIPYEDNNIVFFAVASVNSNKEKCFAFLLQKSTGKIYLLII